MVPMPFRIRKIRLIVLDQDSLILLSLKQNLEGFSWGWRFNLLDFEPINVE